MSAIVRGGIPRGMRLISIAQASCVDSRRTPSASSVAITGKIEKNLPFFTAGYRN